MTVLNYFVVVVYFCCFPSKIWKVETSHGHTNFSSYLSKVLLTSLLWVLCDTNTT